MPGAGALWPGSGKPGRLLTELFVAGPAATKVLLPPLIPVLLTKWSRRDVKRMLENAGRRLRFSAELVSSLPVDTYRRYSVLLFGLLTGPFSGFNTLGLELFFKLNFSKFTSSGS